MQIKSSVKKAFFLKKNEKYSNCLKSKINKWLKMEKLNAVSKRLHLFQMHRMKPHWQIYSKNCSDRSRT